MRTSHWLSERFARLSRRERWVIGVGAAIAVVALVTVYAVLPFARRWSERESAIAAKAESVARLESLIQAAPRLRAAVDELAGTRQRAARALVTGSTPALAASSLQTLIKGYADRSRVTLQQVDVGREPEPVEGGLSRIDLQLRGLGDVYGLVDLLFYVQNGEKLLIPDELRVVASPSRGTGEQLLSWTIDLHAYYSPEEGES